MINNKNSFCIDDKHQNVFSKYKDCNIGKDVVLVATGKSLQNFKPIEDVIYVGLSRAFQYDKVKFDFLFLQDYSDKTKDYINDFLKYKGNETKKFLGFLDYETDKNSIISKNDFLTKNVERYFSALPSEKNNLAFDIASMPLGESYSIVFPAMQFILWTHPKKIYIVGCDCNTSDCFYKKTNDLAVNNVMDGWKRLSEFVQTYYPDIEVISINPVGLKGIFKDYYSENNEYKSEKTILSDDRYTTLYKELHYKSNVYGTSSIEFIDEINLFIDYLKPKTVLDYGCGKGVLLDKLKIKYPEIKFFGYDPSVQEYSKLAINAVDLVINTDVLEHIPENILPNVINKISKLSSNVFFSLHHAKASAILPNGENAHCTVKPVEWYKELFEKYFQNVKSLQGRHDYTSSVITFEIPNDVKNRYFNIINKEK